MINQILKKLFELEFLRWSSYKSKVILMKGNPTLQDIVPHPDHDGRCYKCSSELFFSHGYLRTNTGGITICPNDLIIVYKNKSHYFSSLNKILKGNQ